MIEYVPKIRDTPKIVKVISAWGDIPTIIKDIIVTFNVDPQIALEFGVNMDTLHQHYLIILQKLLV